MAQRNTTQTMAPLCRIYSCRMSWSLPLYFICYCSTKRAGKWMGLVQMARQAERNCPVNFFFAKICIFSWLVNNMSSHQIITFPHLNVEEPANHLDPLSIELNVPSSLSDGWHSSSLLAVPSCRFFQTKNDWLLERHCTYRVKLRPSLSITHFHPTSGMIWW